MSKYTTQLRNYIESFSNESLSNKQKIEVGRSKLFDFDYPIFDSTYKNVFETHFIRNFYMREIGFETVGLFKFQLETWLLINMPYFNKLFESELLKYDVLTNSNMKVTHTKTNDKNQNETKNSTQTIETDETQTKTITQTNAIDETNTQTVDSNNTETRNLTDTKTGDKFARKLESNNPDSRLAITTQDGSGVIEYASQINEDKNTLSETDRETGTVGNVGTSTGNGSVARDEEINVSDNGTVNLDTSKTSNDTGSSIINETEDFIQERIGKVGVQSYPKLVQEYRNSLLRIEKQMFQEMQDLFMLVY